MLCHAHSVGARVTFGSGGLAISQWHNKTAVDAWVASSVAKVKSSYADGLNIDIELAASAPADVAALTALTAQMAAAMHHAVPGSHVTYDTPSLGLLEEGGCGKQYGRAYDYKGLAQVCDFLVVMDYDSNDYSKAGSKDCPTCFYANDALPVAKAGVECYQQLGVPASKLVLAFPWYGYDYTCSPGDRPEADECKVTKAAQLGYPAAASGLTKAVGGGRRWDAGSSTPYYFYNDNDDVQGGGGGVTTTLHRVDYDDVESLKLKYAYAKEAGVRGVGMWTASSIDYANASQVQEFWEALKVFK